MLITPGSRGAISMLEFLERPALRWWKLCKDPHTEKMQVCKSCDTEYTQESFYKNNWGYFKKCRSCHNVQCNEQKARRKLYPHPPTNVCFICRKDGKLVLDHSHETGFVRGWLCGRCNSTLGVLGESNVQRAAEYLSTPPGVNWRP